MANTKAKPETNEKKTKKVSNKKILTFVLIIALAIVTIVVIVNSNSKQYGKKIELVMTALNSEEKMNEALKNAIDVKGAIAWQNTEGDAKKFEEKLKEVKNDNEKIDEAKNAFIKFATSEKKTTEYSVKSVDKVTKNKENGKIKEVNAQINKKEYKFYFYNGKIIDIVVVDDNESMFKYIFWSYNQQEYKV